MNEQEMLKKCLDEAVRIARINKNILAKEQLNGLFEELGLSEEKIALVEEFLSTKKIQVLKSFEIQELQEREATEADDDLDLDSEDKTAIDFYYEELKELPYLTDREKEKIIKAAIEGDVDAQGRLVNIYLPQVVEIAKLYAGQGILVEDLIGEGNIALVMGSQLLNCVETIEEVDGFMGKTIMDAMDALVNDEQEDEKLVIKLGKQLKENKGNKGNAEAGSGIMNAGSGSINSEPTGINTLDNDPLLREAFEALEEDETT